MEQLPRPIRPDEVAVIRAAFEVGTELDIEMEEPTMRALDSLTVVDRCKCGCASVFFEVPDNAPRSMLLADAHGDTRTPVTVGIQVWGRPDAITALDIYYYDEDEVDGLLPELAAIRPFGNKSNEECVDEPGANS